ncbi:hypothetical protein [Nitrosomonas oligotropha]|uniref:hypothetical protein n=1 Tax=Nitrosomonas oligotropha TaxID=42354 RepID=UPI00210F1424|nr:hypothetical protein [Nitrosomonas oligotropha]
MELSWFTALAATPVALIFVMHWVLILAPYSRRPTIQSTKNKAAAVFSAWQMFHVLRGDLIRLLVVANDLKKLNALSSDDRDFVAEIILRLNDGLTYLEGAR